MNQYAVRNIKPKKRKNTMFYLGLKEKKEVILECGDSALVMYEFYISKGGMKDYMFSDKKTGMALGWNESKVKRIRLKLEKHRYIKTLTFKNPKGKFIVTYLSKENVSETEQKSFKESEVISPRSNLVLFDATSEPDIIQEPEDINPFGSNTEIKSDKQ